MKIVYTADTHWGQKESGNHECLQMLNRLQAEHPDILIHCGDAGNQRLRDVQEFYTLLRAALPGIPILVVWGNHDWWDSTFLMSSQTLEEGLQGVVEAQGLHLLAGRPYRAPGVVVAGLSGWYTGQPQTNDSTFIPEYLDFDRRQRQQVAPEFLSALQAFDDSRWGPRLDISPPNLHILVSHFGPPEHLDSRDAQWCLPPRWLDFLDDVDIWCYGHSHAEVNQRAANGRTLLKNCGSDYGAPKYGVLTYEGL